MKIGRTVLVRTNPTYPTAEHSPRLPNREKGRTPVSTELCPVYQELRSRSFTTRSIKSKQPRHPRHPGCSSSASLRRLLLFKPAVHRRDEQQRQERGCDQSPDDDRCKRFLYFRACSTGVKHRDQAEYGDGCGHDHRTQSVSAALENCLCEVQPFLNPQLRNAGYQNDSVQHCHSEEHDESDRSRNRQVQAGNP